MKKHLHFIWGLIAGFVLLMPCGVRAQTYALKITNTDGTVKEVNLSNLKKITFPNPNMNLFYKNLTSESLTLTSVRSMIFSTPTGVVSAVENVLSVYPNPARNYIQLNNLRIEDKEIKIFNASGALVKYNSTGSFSQHVDVSDLSGGVYIIRVGNKMLKFIKL